MSSSEERRSNIDITLNKGLFFFILSLLKVKEHPLLEGLSAEFQENVFVVTTAAL